MRRDGGSEPAIEFKRAQAEDAAACVVLRGQTRENAVSVKRLRQLGITEASWSADVRCGALTGWVAWGASEMAGYCFGAPATGEIVVLALRPAYEGRGLGAALLERLVQDLRDIGHTRLFLGCDPDPWVRSYGFYRHLGWRSTGTFDAHGDEILEWSAGDRRGGP